MVVFHYVLYIFVLFAILEGERRSQSGKYSETCEDERHASLTSVAPS
jgi:hypothetical protein